MKSPAPDARSLDEIVTLSPAFMLLPSPTIAELLSITIFTAIDAPTAVLSPPSPPQLPGLSQVTSEATAIAHARFTILFVAVDVMPTFPGAVIWTFSPIFACC